MIRIWSLLNDKLYCIFLLYPSNSSETNMYKRNAALPISQRVRREIYEEPQKMIRTPDSSKRDMERRKSKTFRALGRPECKPPYPCLYWGLRKSSRTLTMPALPPALAATASRKASVWAQSFSRAADEGLPNDTVNDRC